MLELPPTIHFATQEEIPKGHTVNANDWKVANLVEGYKFYYNTENQDISYVFFAEININNSRLWELFIALCSALPQEVELLYCIYGDEISHGKGRSKSDILKMLHGYKNQLTKDAFIEFGLIYQGEDKMEEVFISEAKYIKYWGCNEVFFRTTMRTFGLDEIENLRFVDEFPKIVTSLPTMDGNNKYHADVIEEFHEYFTPKKPKWKFW